MLDTELKRDDFKLPTLQLEDGYNTRQAMAYGFRNWRDFFNVRQLLALGWLHEALAALPEEKGRDAFLTLFSGVLEFNNMFASYKGEGTGAVRHMFAHHVLKPERVPLEANVWGTPKSSGSFITMFEGRIRRALDYAEDPFELRVQVRAGKKAGKKVFGLSEKISFDVADNYADFSSGKRIYLSCGDSGDTDLADRSVDAVLTDPPFFDNVHYSELADFFYAWQQLAPRGFINSAASTRKQEEVQDTNADRFAEKLKAVFLECHRVLKDGRLLVFTYHHSRDAGWTALAEAILGGGFTVVNAHPLKAEMSVATPKAQAKEPIQLDIAIVCRKTSVASDPPDREAAIVFAERKLSRLEGAGFILSHNDKKTILFGQLLTTLSNTAELTDVAKAVDRRLAALPVAHPPDDSRASQGHAGV